MANGNEVLNNIVGTEKLVTPAQQQTQPEPAQDDEARLQEIDDRLEIIRIDKRLAEIRSEQPKEEAVQESTENLDQETETVQQIFKGAFGSGTAENLIVNGAIAPLVEVSRGLYEGNSRFFGSLDAVSQMVRKLGIPSPEIFGEIAAEQRKIAEELPETQMSKVLSIPYNLIGTAIPTVTEFATAGKFLSATGVQGLLKMSGLQKLTPAAEFALIQGLSEYEDNPENSSFVKGAIEGATLGMTFGIAAKGLKLLYNFGKTTAQAWVRFTTGNPTLAKEFVNNPKKFNLNPFTKKVKTPDEIKAEAVTIRERVKNKYSEEKRVFKEKQDIDKQILDSRLRDSEQALRQSQEVARQSLKEGSQTNLVRATDKANKAISEANSVMTEKTTKVYDEALTKYDLLRRESGEQVGAAVDALVQRDPLARIPSSTVNKRVNSVVKELNPFRKDSPRGKFLPRTAAAPGSDAELFNNIMTEYKAMARQEGGLSPQYLQNLKKDLQIRADEAFKAGKHEIGKLYSTMSKAVNPAKIVSKNPQLAGSLKELRTANKEFADYIPKYEEAMKQYFKKDAQGNFIPDVGKAVRAVNGADNATLRQMEKADAALRPEDRILPKVRELIRDSKKIEEFQRSIVKDLKKKAQKEIFEFDQAAKKSIQNIQNENRTLTVETKREAMRNLAKFKELKDGEYANIINQLNAWEEFISHQFTLRGLQAGARYKASLIQNVAGFGAAGALQFGKPGAAAGGAALAGLISPAVSGIVTKFGLKMSQTGTNVLTNLLENSVTSKVIGREILED